MTLPRTRLAERATVRLISTAYFKPPILAALVDSEDELDSLAALEGLTNGRLLAERDGLPDLNPRELAFSARDRALRSWGDTYVNAAFAHTREGGNRFSDGRRGAWYCAFDELTAIEEVAFHRTRELTYANRFVDEAVYVALLAAFIGDGFADLRGIEPVPDCLAADIAVGYAAGQALARELRGAGAKGLIYPSVRRHGGVCLVAFEPQVVQDVRPAARWKLVWDGSPNYTVTTD